jgi:hypothetical protein
VHWVEVQIIHKMLPSPADYGRPERAPALGRKANGWGTDEFGYREIAAEVAVAKSTTVAAFTRKRPTHIRRASADPSVRARKLFRWARIMPLALPRLKLVMLYKKRSPRRTIREIVPLWALLIESGDRKPCPPPSSSWRH